MNDVSGPFMVCTSADDLGDPRALTIIGRGARDYLDRNKLTPTELVYLAAHGRALNEAGTMLAAIVQKIAIAQSQGSERPVGQRIKELYAFCAAAIENADAREKKIPGPTLTGELLSTLLGELHDDGPRIARTALARHLADATDWLTKVDRCCALLEDGASTRAITAIDDLLAELLASDAASGVLVGQPETAAAKIEGLIALGADEDIKGNTVTLPAASRRLRDHIRAGRLPETRSACRVRIVETLAGPMRMASKSSFDEFEALSSVAAKLKKAVSFAAALDFEQELEKRMARIVTLENFPGFLEGTSGFGEKLIRALDIYERTIGATPRADVLKFVTFLAQHRDLEAQFAPKLSPADRRALATQVLQTVLDSGMPESRREVIRKVLEPVLKKIAADDKGGARKGPGPEDHVLMNGVRLPLKKWSPAGILFGPMPDPPAIGSRVNLQISVRHDRGKIDFDADAEILQVNNGDIAARYTCRTPAVVPEIKAYFAT